MTGPVVPSDEDELRELMLRTLVSFGVDLAQETTDALLPVVLADRERYADQRAAEELRAAADAYWRDVDFPIARYPEVRDWLRARAAALTAREEAGR